jgi:hypothetical protein
MFSLVTVTAEENSFWSSWQTEAENLEDIGKPEFAGGAKLTWIPQSYA